MTQWLSLAVLLFGALMALWVLWEISRSDHPFRIADLLVDQDKDGKTRASWTKITAIGAFMIASWVVVRLTIDARMTEWLFGFYVCVYSGAPVAYRIIASRLPPEPPQQTVTVTAPASSSVGATVDPK